MVYFNRSLHYCKESSRTATTKSLNNQSGQPARLLLDDDVPAVNSEIDKISSFWET